MQDPLVLLDRSKIRSSQERSVGKVAFFCAACYCCLHCTPGGGSIVHTADLSRMTLSSGSCSEQGVIAAVTVRALFHSVCLCSAAARAAPFAHAQNTQIGFLFFRGYLNNKYTNKIVKVFHTPLSLDVTTRGIVPITVQLFQSSGSASVFCCFFFLLLKERAAERAVFLKRTCC